MKIAVVTDDGRTISQHFGRAPYYAVLTIQDGSVTSRELRPKSAPHLTGGAVPGHAGSDPHGTDPQAQARHDQMASVIGDCTAVIAGGMGRGASERLQALGLRSILTELLDIEEAALAFARCPRGPPRVAALRAGQASSYGLPIVLGSCRRQMVEGAHQSHLVVRRQSILEDGQIDFFLVEMRPQQDVQP